jgi:hypothetical protein
MTTQRCVCMRACAHVVSARSCLTNACLFSHTHLRLLLLCLQAVTFSTLICGFYPLLHSILYIILQVGIMAAASWLGCALHVGILPELECHHPADDRLDCVFA